MFNTAVFNSNPFNSPFIVVEDTIPMPRNRPVPLNAKNKTLTVLNAKAQGSALSASSESVILR